MRQNFALHLRKAADRVAVDFQHLTNRHCVNRRVKVAGIGQQKFECVANATIDVHHARQNFVIN